jgi:hypothetical protein
MPPPSPPENVAKPLTLDCSQFKDPRPVMSLIGLSGQPALWKMRGMSRPVEPPTRTEFEAARCDRCDVCDAEGLAGSRSGGRREGR